MALHERDSQEYIEFAFDSAAPAKHNSVSGYYRLLTERLSLPFRAVYHEPVGLTEDVTHEVTVVALCEPLKDVADHGLMCRAIHQEKALELPLVEVEVAPDNPNFRLIEEYWFWAWNDL